MAGGAGAGIGDPSNGGPGPQGTEYTLQGVMRFLQAEWHRHERERNLWEIERAEMKSRIGRLEGEARTNKRMSESLGKHVRILETALKQEREKNRKLVAGEKVASEEQPDGHRDPKEIAKENLKTLPKYTNAASTNIEGIEEIRHEAEREKSRLYLNKCLSEVSYHVLPGTHPPPDLADLQEDSSPNGYSNNSNINQHSSSSPYDDPYNYGYQQQQQQQQQQQTRWRLQPPHQQQQQQNINQSQVQNQNQNQPVVRYGRRQSDRQDSWSLGGAGGAGGNGGDIPSAGYPMTREISAPDRQRYEIHTRQSRNLQQPQQQQQQQPQQRPQPQGRPSNEPPRISQENLSPVQDTGDHRTPRIEQQPNAPSDDNEGWNFDEPQIANPIHRPDVDKFPSANLTSQDINKSATTSSSSSSPSQQNGADSETDNAPQPNGYSPDSSSSSPLVKKKENRNFDMKFALRGHLDVIRCVIFTGGGSPSEPEICTCGDDMTIKRWVIPASYGAASTGQSPFTSDVDVTSYFTHRGHTGAVTCLAACPPSPNIASGGRALGDGWIFSGGQDGTVKVWERGRVDAKASLEGHTDAVWSICVLPGTAGSVFGADRASNYGGADRILLVSASADGTVRVWAVSAPPQINSPQQNNGRGRAGGRRSNSISSGSNFPSSPQPSTATQTPFYYTLVHTITPRCGDAGENVVVVPTCVSALSPAGMNFAVSFDDASIRVYDTKTGEEVKQMGDAEGYDGTHETSLNAIVAKMAAGSDENNSTSGTGEGNEDGVIGSGVIIGGYEDKYIRFFNSSDGQCTHSMLGHPAAVSSLSLSPDGGEFVSGGHDGGLRIWSLEKRSCIQEITAHRPLGDEGVCSVSWSQDGRWVVSGGGDGVVKVFSR